MENDRKTVPTSMNIIIENSERYLEKLKKSAEEQDLNIGGEEFIAIGDLDHDLTPEEIYFEDGVLHVGFNAISREGSTSVYLDVPLSQEVLFDILAESIKKFNKIKTMFEVTK